MAPQAARPGKRPAAGANAPDPNAPQGAEPNLLEQLRRERETPAQGRDLIPIPAMIIVFALVWGLVVALMWPGWGDNFDNYLARSRQRSGDYTGAIKPLSELAAKYPDNATYQAELAHSYLQTGEYQKAVEHYQAAQKLIEASPATDEDGRPIARADFNGMIGRSYLKAGDLPNAEKHLGLALKHDRLDKLVNLTMGELYVQKKNFPEAMKYFKVVAADPAYRDQVTEYYEQIEKELFGSIS